MTFRRGLAVALALMLVASAVVVVADGTGEYSEVNEDADAAPDLLWSGNVTKATHDMGEWGTDPEGLKTYEDNNGDTAVINGEVNESGDTPYSYIVTDVAADDFDEFPHSKEDTSALNASEWSKDMTGSTGSASVSDVETAQGVEAVQFDVNGQTSGDNATFTFNNFSLTSDINKRVFSIAADVSTLESSAHILIRAYDTDGDSIDYIINSGNANNKDILANSTGEGWLEQSKIGDRTVTTRGDGTMAEIQKIQVTVLDANATFSLSLLNLDKTGKYQFGNYLNDTDGDGNLETDTVTRTTDPGRIHITDPETLGSAFDNAKIRDLRVPIDKTLEHADAVQLNVSEAPDYQYPYKMDLRVKLHLESAYDLSWETEDVNETVPLPSSRYGSVSKATNVGEDTALENISYSTDITGSYSSQGASVTVFSGLSEGTHVAVEYDTVLLTDSDQQAIVPMADTGDGAGGGGGGGFFTGGSGGGFLGGIFEEIMGTLTGFAAALGLVRRRKAGG